MKEYDNGIKHEKSALKNFAEKYVIDGKPKIIPLFQNPPFQAWNEHLHYLPKISDNFNFGQK